MIDKNLEQYATDKQWLYYCAAEEHGSGAKAAEILGVNRATLTKAIFLNVLTCLENTLISINQISKYYQCYEYKN